MADDRRTLEYRGYSLVAAFYKGKFQGKAWHKRTNAHLVVDGQSLDDVVKKLHADVDKQFEPDVVVGKHRQFLASRNEPDQGTRGSGRRHRDSHCYSCTTPVDNAVDLECIACGWIICSYCGACGCGYGIAKQTAPKPSVASAYTQDWPEISLARRVAVGFKCAKCFVVLTDKRHLLHVHHLNEDKSDNHIGNLIVVCIECHDRFHGVPTAIPEDDRRYLAQLRKQTNAREQ